jgi:hypothetical protein
MNKEDILADIVGKANARVTCSFDLKDSSFGKGFSAMCSVTLSCDQTEDGIEIAGELAGAVAADLARKYYDTALELFREKVPR